MGAGQSGLGKGAGGVGEVDDQDATSLWKALDAGTDPTAAPVDRAAEPARPGLEHVDPKLGGQRAVTGEEPGQLP